MLKLGDILQEEVAKFLKENREVILAKTKERIDAENKSEVTSQDSKSDDAEKELSELP